MPKGYPKNGKNVGWFKKTGKYIKCEICDKDFYAIKSRKRARFCSSDCYHKFPKNKNLFQKTCLLCNNKYFVTKSRISKTKYCSKKCACIAIGKIGGASSAGVSRNAGVKRPYLAIRNKLNPMRGENNPNWKGGITHKNVKERQKLYKKNWNKDIFERDEYSCQLCFKRGGNLEAHHILRFIDYPEFRDKIWNGICLCQKCHNLTKGKERHYVEMFLYKTHKHIMIE